MFLLSYLTYIPWKWLFPPFYHTVHTPQALGRWKLLELFFFFLPEGEWEKVRRGVRNWARVLSLFLWCLPKEGPEDSGDRHTDRETKALVAGGKLGGMPRKEYQEKALGVDKRQRWAGSGRGWGIRAVSRWRGFALLS